MVKIAGWTTTWRREDVEEERKRGGRFYRRIEAAVCTEYRCIVYKGYLNSPDRNNNRIK